VIFGVVGLDLAPFVEGEVQTIFVHAKKLRHLELEANSFTLEQKLWSIYLALTGLNNEQKF
jgi:hypothetical protein